VAAEAVAAAAAGSGSRKLAPFPNRFFTSRSPWA